MKRFRRRLAVLSLATVMGAGAGCEASPAAAATAAGAHVQGGEWFVQSGCTACHPVTAYGLWTPAVNAPDLSIAVAEVPIRFGRSLDDFVRAPTGTMAMVLSGRIVMDADGREVAIQKLKEAYSIHQQKNLPAHPAASH